ncbi:hypothetical protein SLA2020_303060 [Shorea laevis]
MVNTRSQSFQGTGRRPAGSGGSLKARNASRNNVIPPSIPMQERVMVIVRQQEPPQATPKTQLEAAQARIKALTRQNAVLARRAYDPLPHQQPSCVATDQQVPPLLQHEEGWLSRCRCGASSLTPLA